MKKILIVLSSIVFLMVIGIGFTKFTNKTMSATPQPEASLTNIRIGWQVPWATEGQLTQVLKQTDILKNNGLSGDFKGFDSGAPLNEAALAKGVDVIFTADQPAATLLSKNQDWVIIGRLMYNRVSLYVPPNSPIKTVRDLKNKTVGMPFGASAQRKALQAEKAAGLDPKKDVNNVNLGIYEQSDLVRDPSATKWGSMDALAGFDPTPAIFEEKGLTRTLSTDNVVSVIVMSKSYIQAHPEVPVQFLKSFNSAYEFYRDNTSTADNWYITESKLNITSQALKIASGVEPNLSASSSGKIRLSFIDEDYTALQDAADFLFDQSLIKSKVIMKDHIDLSYLNRAALN